jgi:hypothetical protein
LPGEQGLGQREGADGVAFDVVAAVHLRDPDPPGPVQSERVAPHVGADPEFRMGGAEWGAGGDRAADRTVPIEVIGVGQHRAAAFRGREQRGRQRRPVGEPLVVLRVGAVVEDIGALGQSREPVGIRSVRGDPLDGGMVEAAAAASHDPNPVAPLGEQGGDAAADGTGTDDDV